MTSQCGRVTQPTSGNDEPPLLCSSPSEADAADNTVPIPSTLRCTVATAGSSNTRMQRSDGTTGNHVRAAARQERQVKRNLVLNYDYYEYFVYSQCLPAWLLLLLRLLMGGVCVSVFLYMTIRAPFVNFVPGNSTSGIEDIADNTTDQPPVSFKRHFYLCYLTIWSYLIITVYFVTTLINTVAICAASSASSMDSQGAAGNFSLASSGFKSTENLLDQHAVAAPPDGAARRFGLRLQWLLCGISANAALIVTLAYFAFLYPMIQRARPGPISPVDLLVHGFNSVFMFLEVALSGVPVRLVHGLYTAVYGLCYALFSLLYWIPDHTNVMYPMLLDWNNASLTIGMLCLILFVGLPLVQLVWWLVYLARCFVAAVLVSQSNTWSPGLEV